MGRWLKQYSYNKHAIQLKTKTGVSRCFVINDIPISPIVITFCCIMAGSLTICKREVEGEKNEGNLIKTETETQAI